MKKTKKLRFIFLFAIFLFILFNGLANASFDYEKDSEYAQEIEASSRGMKTTTKVIIYNQLLATILSIIVLFDAAGIKVKNEGSPVGGHEATVWLLLVFICWLAVLPLYFLERRKVLKET
jgi:hypothetical protein